MANNVTAQILGEDPRILNGVLTVEDVKDELGVLEGSYSASVNGEPADDDYELADFENVTLSPSVKGG